MVGPTDAETSSRIRIARVLCIFFMMYAHIDLPGAGTSEIWPGSDPPVDAIFLAVTQLFSRAGVPLLSAISGWLLVESLSRHSHGRVLAARVSTLLLPMVAWNVVLLGTLLVYWTVSGLPWVIPGGFARAVNAVFAVTDRPINYPLFFLRDLFVCMAVSPVLLRAGRSYPWITVAACGALAVFLPAGTVLIRPQILFFFSLGLVLRARNADATALDRWIVVAGMVFLAMGLLRIGVNDSLSQVPMLPFWKLVDDISRLSGVVFFWIVTARLVRTQLGGWLVALEAYIFIVFCSHLIAFQALNLFARTAIADEIHIALQPLYFAALPVAAVAAAVLATEVGRTLAPSLVHLLNGGRPIAPGERRLALAAATGGRGAQR